MKERFLTVLVPIKDSDATFVSSLPTASASNVNVIYKHNGVYKRSTLNTSTGQYEYVVVKDREFPYLGEPMEIFDFSYDATRMGNAPMISAQNVMWYAKKDARGNDITLDGLFLERFGECHVSFNGENLYLKQVPTCGKDNEDARYKYDMDFVSERVVLEKVYLYDVVQPFITEKPISESATFSFYGDIGELAKRINASLRKSGLASLELRDNVSSFLSYEEFNSLGLGTFHYPESWSSNMRQQFYTIIYANNNGDYNKYLRNNVYKVDSDGEFIQSGYICKIGKDKKGEMTTSDEKLIQFDKNYIHDALQKVHDDFELQYYIYSEKDSNGNFTGNTIIMIADCEHDFADVSGDDYVRDADGIPTTTHPFDYGVTDALISKEKTNTTDKIITRITGVGSEDNIPWYYPNPNADGWIRPIYSRGGSEIQNMVNYPLSEGSTVPENVLYEKYIKNRLGFEYMYKKLIESFYLGSDVAQLTYVTSSNIFLSAAFEINVNEVFHLESRNALNRYDNVEPSQIVINKKQSNGTYTNVAVHNQSTLPSTEFQSGYYRVIFQFTFSERPAKNDFKWYYVPVADGVEHSQWAYPLLVDSNKVSESEVLSLRMEWTGRYYWWYYTSDSDGLNKVAFGYADGNDSYYQMNGFYALVNGANYSPEGACKIFTDMSEPDGGWDGKYYIVKIVSGEITQRTQTNFLTENEIYTKYITGTFGVYTKHWTKDNKNIDLSTVGLSLNGTEVYGDVIKFQRVKYLTPQKTLMPQVYIKTDGERRFYNAVNYPINGSTPDEAIGEESSGGQIINPLYYKEGTTTHYDFENEYIQERPHEHIEPFDDIKPSIKGQVNTVSGQTFRIDVVEEFAYDEHDDDDIWENNDNGNISGEYKHPYFFAKLRPLGFNIFDLALQEDMVISMTTGHCGACNFKIGVDENTKKNPVQIWEYDVYEGADFATKTFRYSAGTLRRYMDTSNLYYDTNGTAAGYIQVGRTSSPIEGFLWQKEIDTDNSSFYGRSVYSAEDVMNGMVGALKQEGKAHFDGDVLTSGKFIESQQDTSENYVWVALMKDTETYGVIMPSAKQDYVDPNFNVYIRPKSIADVHTSTSTPIEDEENADKFVIINIRMPQIYLRRAEEELSKKIIEHMYDNNYQKFNFSINFSRIFLSDNEEVDGYLNENSVLYVNFNNKIYRQYVKHYVYRMSKGEALPEINVDMNEELSVSRTQAQRNAVMQQSTSIANARMLRAAISYSEGRMSRRTIGKNEDAIVSGNLVSRNAVTSFSELQIARKNTESDIFDTQTDLNVNHFKKGDFVLSEKQLKIGDDIVVPSKNFFDYSISEINAFNADVKEKINKIRKTVEYRLPVAAGGTLSSGCEYYKYNVDPRKKTSALLWLNEDGSLKTQGYDICSTATNMTDVKWVDIDPD